MIQRPSLAAFALSTFSLGVCLHFGAAPVHAAETPKVSEEATLGPEMEALLAEEKAGRKACKIEICGIVFHPERPGDDISCRVEKTVPKPHLDEIIKVSRMSWPWGHAKCDTDLNISRAALSTALTSDKNEYEMGKHTVHCTVERADGDPYVIKVSIDPMITFENGHATKAEIRFGDIEAPAVAKSAIWPAAKLDNNFGVFSGKVVEIVNTFIDKKCAEVKDDIPAG